MGNLLEKLNWEEQIEIEVMSTGFSCPYCLDLCSAHRGHDQCIKIMGEEKNVEFNNFSFEMEGV